MVKPKALIACLADPSGNPRPNRAIQLLHQIGYEVWVLSPAPKNKAYEISKVLPLKSIKLSPIRKLLYRTCILIQAITAITQTHSSRIDKLPLIAMGGRQHISQIQKESFQVILIEDIIFLPVILEAKYNQSAIIFDAREYYPREFESSLIFKLLHAPRFTAILHQSLSKLDGFYTVCDSLADEYLRVFGRRPDVVRSTPYRLAIQPNLRQSTPLRIVHHGVAHADRGLATMIEAIRMLNGRFTLDLYLVGSPSHVRMLRALAADCPWVYFRDPVPFSELGHTLAQYDIGFCLLQPSTFNLKYALPNKFFEFIQARLAVLAGPSPELSRLITQYSLGVTSTDFSAQSAAEQLSQLTPEKVNAMKACADHAAQELCWEVESERLRFTIEMAICHRNSRLS